MTAQQLLARTLDVQAVQKALAEEKLDGWLFYFFHDNDPLALTILGLNSGHLVSRRWFYFIPVKGEPVKLVHRIEMEALDTLPGNKVVYLGWRQLEAELATILKGKRRVAMQYSPNNAIPYVSRVDAGTIDLVKSFGTEVVSSADLVSRFESTWTEGQLSTHKQAADFLRATVEYAFVEIKDAINSGRQINEYDIQQFICRGFDEAGFTYNSPPIVAVNEHSGSPHYQPTADKHSPIKEGDFVLIDLWAKLKEPHDAVYADITWTGYVGEKVPEKYQKIFAIVAGARDEAVKTVRKAISDKKEIHGFEVDDACRKYITDRGFGQAFVHRTGHSIGLEVHANGANIDNLETCDRRKLIPFTCFSIEPGIYLPEFGIRSEIDVYITDQDVIIAGQPIQTEVIPIMSL
jgi:Xaa-Pro aminopeptidase